MPGTGVTPLQFEVGFQPEAPYSLAASAGLPDPCRRYRGGVLELVYAVADGTAAASVWQTRDGGVHARVRAHEQAVAHDRLRTLLRVDLNLAPFLAFARRDPLLRPLESRMKGHRPLLLGSPPQALVRGVCGQLVRSSDAIRFEHRVVRGLRPGASGLLDPPTADELRRVHPARFEQAGLSPGRALTLRRGALLDWSALAAAPTTAAAARLLDVRGIGPWTAATVLLYGLGRMERGLAGDLALIRLCSALDGRPADVGDTQRLLDRYGEWAGPASIWLLAHPLARRRHPPAGRRYELSARR